MVEYFDELRAKMSPKRREANQQQAQEIIVALEPADLRKRLGLPPKELAERLNVQQSAVAKVVSRADLHVSTLREHVEAMGGRLELVARCPDESIMLTSLRLMTANVSVAFSKLPFIQGGFYAINPQACSFNFSATAYSPCFIFGVQNYWTKY